LTASTDGRVRPNFFIVGAPKAGTTSMHDYLGQHPQIFMSQAKAPGYFATELGVRTAWSQSLERYLALFTEAADVPVRGESSPSYLFNPAAAERIHDFEPRARILILLRNPIEAIQALHGEARKFGLEPHRDFARALAASDAGRPKIENSYGGFWTRYRAFVHYTPQVRRYLDAFPADAVKIVIYDDFAAEPSAVYRGILEFLDVDPTFAPTFQRMNAYRGDVRSYQVQRLLMWVAAGPGTSGIRGTGNPLVRRAAHAALRRNAIRMKRRPLDPALRTALVADLRPDVDALSELLGRDLSGWLGGADGPAAAANMSGTDSTLPGF
jgi:hypothetical protein